MNKSVQHKMKGANHRLKPPVNYSANSDGNDPKTSSALSKDSLKTSSGTRITKNRSTTSNNTKTESTKQERQSCTTIGRPAPRSQRSGIPQPGTNRSKPNPTKQSSNETGSSNKKKITRSRSPRLKNTNDDKVSISSSEGFSMVTGRCSPGRSTPIPGRGRARTRIRNASDITGELIQSPPPVRGAWCQNCDQRLKELKRRAIKMWNLIMDSKAMDNKDITILRRIEAGLRLSDGARATLRPDGLCDVCSTHVALLQREAIAMVQSLDRSQGGHVSSSTLQRYASGAGETLADPDNGNLPNPANATAQNNQKHARTASGNAARNNMSGLPRTTANRHVSSTSGSKLPHGVSTDHQRNYIYHQLSHHKMLANAGPQVNPMSNNGPQYVTVQEPQHHQHSQLQHPHPASDQKMITSSPYGQHQAARPMQLPVHPDYIANSESSQQQQQQHQSSQHVSQKQPFTAQQAYAQQRAHQKVQYKQLHQGQPHPVHPVPYPVREQVPYDGNHPLIGHPDLAPPGAQVGASAAASFFARAAQKLTMSSRKKRKHVSPEPLQAAQFATNFSDVIRHRPPAAPPCLLRAPSGRLPAASSSKVKVMLKVCPVDMSTSSFLQVDSRKKQVTLYDPSTMGYTAQAHRKPGSAAPKMFAFDSVFGQDDSLSEVCASSLPEIVQAVVNGADGCLFCYGHARLGKTYTMLGVDDQTQNLGVLPCAIAWLFKVVNEQKESSGSRFSVRVSAVEVTGKQEMLKDLLADVAQGVDSGKDSSPGVYLREDPICGTQLENQCELRAPTAERAAHYLDAAISARTIPEVEDDARNSHLLFTLHVYQYRVEKSGGGKDGVAGGRSRLHLIDLGSCSKSKDGNALSLSALGNVILALLNGQRHVPYRESKLTQLMRESLGNFSCRTCLIAHVSPAMQAYNETLQVIQLAAKIHRMKRRRNKMSASSDDSSCDGSSHSSHSSHRRRVGVRMGVLREDAVYTNALSASEHDYSSSSEQSCDTVIYMPRHHDYIDECPPPMAPLGTSPPLYGQQRPQASGVRFATTGDSSDGESVSSGGRDRSVPKCGATMSKAAKIRAAAAAGKTYSSTVERATRKHVKRTLVEQSEPALKAAWSKSPYREGVQRTECWIDGPGTSNDSAAPERPAEHWIDGPPEFQLVQQSTPSPAQRRKKMWTEQKPAPPPRGVSLRNHPGASHASPAPYAGAEQQRVSNDVYNHTNNQDNSYANGRLQMVYGCAKTYGAAPAAISSIPCDPRHGAMQDIEQTVPLAEIPAATPAATLPGAHYKDHTPHHSSSPLRKHKTADVARTPAQQRRSGDMESPSSPSQNCRECISSPRLPHRTVSTSHSPAPTTHASPHNVCAVDTTPPVPSATPTSSLPAGMPEKPTDNLESASHPPTKHVKNFVKDWVAVHSLPNTDQTNDPGDASANDQLPSSPAHTAPLNATDKPRKHHRHKTHLHSHSLPTSSHSTPRLKKKLKSSLLATPQKSLERVSAWVESVTGVAVPLNTEQELRHATTAVNNESETIVFPTPDDDEGPPPAYDTCVSDMGSVGDENLSLYDEIEDVEAGLTCEAYETTHTEEKIWGTVEEVLSHHSSPERKPRGLNDAPEVSPGPVSLDEKTSSTARDMEASLLESTQEDDAVAKLLNSARESIYELQMEAEMETMSKTSTFNSEDEHSTLGSLPRFKTATKGACILSRLSSRNASLEVCSLDDVEIPSDPLENPYQPLNVCPEVDHQEKDVDEYSLDAEVHESVRKRRPISLRRPDGASNPDLAVSDQSHAPITDPSVKQNEEEFLSSMTRSIPGQCASPLGSSQEPDDSQTSKTPRGSKHSSRNNSKSPHRHSNVASPHRKTSQSPKRGPDGARSSKTSHSPAKDHQTMASPTGNVPSPTSKLPVKSFSSKFGKSSSSKSKKPAEETPVVPEVKETKSRGRSFLFRSRSSSSKSSSPVKTSSKSAQASPSKGFLSRREKSPKDKSKSSTPVASPDINKSKSPSKQSAFAKAFGRKSPKEPKVTSSSKTQHTSSPSPAKTKTASSSSVKTTSSPYNKPSRQTSQSSSRNTDSDSGNDSGIVRTDGKKKLNTSGSSSKRSGREAELLSPYATVTNPRISTRSSSGHGSHFSDMSSTYSTQLMTSHPTTVAIKEDAMTVTTSTRTIEASPACRRRIAEVSSGYESLMHDSECTTGTASSSGTQDSNSDGSTSGSRKEDIDAATDADAEKKQKTPTASRRSRSAPAPSLTTRLETSSLPPSPRFHHKSRDTWSEIQNEADYTGSDLVFPEDQEQIEITLYNVEDVDRIQRRRKEDAEHKVKEKRKFRIRELLDHQEALKYELLEAKNRLMINHDTWSFDLYVAGQHSTGDDEAYLDALETETNILQKRVEACKSRIMMVTCFDVNNT